VDVLSLSRLFYSGWLVTFGSGGAVQFVLQNLRGLADPDDIMHRICRMSISASKKHSNPPTNMQALVSALLLAPLRTRPAPSTERKAGGAPGRSPPLWSATSGARTPGAPPRVPAAGRLLRVWSPCCDCRTWTAPEERPNCARQRSSACRRVLCSCCDRASETSDVHVVLLCRTA